MTWFSYYIMYYIYCIHDYMMTLYCCMWLINNWVYHIMTCTSCAFIYVCLIDNLAKDGFQEASSYCGGLDLNYFWGVRSRMAQVQVSNDGGRGGPGWAMVPPKIRGKKIEEKKIKKKNRKNLVLILVI